MYKLRKGLNREAQKFSPDLTIILISEVKSFKHNFNRIQFIPFSLATFVLTDCSLKS